MLKAKPLILFLILILSFVLYGTVFAFTSDYSNYLQQAAGTSGAGYAATQANDTFINTLIGQIVATLVSLIGLIFLILTVYAGVQWLTSGGNEEKITKAKTKLINGSIGVGLTLCAFIVANLVFSFLNQEFLTQPPPGPTPPAGLENIPCTIDAQCQDQQFQIYCINGQCRECRDSADCMTTARFQAGLSWCNPAWYLCDAPTGTPLPNTCPNYTNVDTCAINGCWWSNGQCSLLLTGPTLSPCPNYYACLSPAACSGTVKTNYSCSNPNDVCCEQDI